MARSNAQGGRGQLRIIGGTWRGRKLRFSAARGLRPTADRTRETLFNWLAPVIHDARCLDLFAGSGSLGLESLSRGAAYCDFVDRARPAVDQIGRHLAELGADHLGSCHNRSADAFLADAADPYDIIFIDPPFDTDLVAGACEQLTTQGLLAEGAFVYIETTANAAAPDVPESWQLHREKVSGGVCYRLYIT